MSNSVENGNTYFACTIIMGILNWSLRNVDPMDLITGAAAVFSAVMAGRYYWYATKEKKARIRQIKDEED